MAISDEKSESETRMDEKELNMHRIGLGRTQIEQFALFDVVLVDAIADLEPQELYILVGAILETYDIRITEVREILEKIRGEEE